MGIIPTILLVSNVLIAPQFCEGIRSAEQYNGMTYKAYLAEYALDLAAAQGIEDQAVIEALKTGATPEIAAVRGIMIRAAAKAEAAVQQETPIRRGQVKICGKQSNNW